MHQIFTKFIQLLFSSIFENVSLNQVIYNIIIPFGEVYSIQHNVINFVCDLWQVSGFLRSTPIFSTNKTDRHDIAEILLKVVLNAITLTITQILFDHDQDAETDYLFNNRHILFYNDWVRTHNLSGDRY
jgi:hypothetical protein